MKNCEQLIRKENLLIIKKEMEMTAQPMNTKITNIIKMRSNHPASIKEMIQSDFAKRLQTLELGLQKTQARLEQFETKYQWSTEKFINLFTSDQLQHSFDFDEWLGEAWMLAKLQQKIAIVREIEFVD